LTGQTEARYYANSVRRAAFTAETGLPFLKCDPEYAMGLADTT
jgi:hypothetical protein